MRDSIWKKAGEMAAEAAAWTLIAPAACFTTALFLVLRGVEWCRLGKQGGRFKKGANRNTEVKRQK